jgi:single-strand DNA-binding protein
VNKVIFIGRLVRDPETRNTASGKMVCRFSIAVNDTRNRKNTYFFNCASFDQPANYVSTYLKKGDMICLEGRLTTNSYTNKDGINVTSTDVIVDSVNSISSSNSERSSKNVVNIQSSKKEDFEFSEILDDSPSNDQSSASIDWMKDLD